MHVWAETGAYGLCWLGWRYKGAKLYFSWPDMKVSMISNSSEQSALHHSRATVIFVVDCCRFGPSCMFGIKWSLWPVPTWFAVKRSKAVFLMTLYDSINDMKQLRNFCITPQLCHSHVCCWLRPIRPYVDFGPKTELMACTGLVGSTTEQSCIFTDILL